jgi:hypothetical protein
LEARTDLKEEEAWDLRIEVWVWVCRGGEILILAIRPRKKRKEHSLNVGGSVRVRYCNAGEIELLEQARFSGRIYGGPGRGSEVDVSLATGHTSIC